MTRTRFIRSRRLLSSAFFILALAFSIAPAFGQSVPQTMNFQGRLAKPDGTPVADTASQSLTFRLYSAATGGTLLWSQSNPVAVRNGTFAAALDFSTGFATGQSLAGVFGNATVTPYLEIQVGTDTPLAPRQPFRSNAYAFLANAALSVPDGSITSAKIANGSVGSSQLASGLLSGFWNLTGNAGTSPSSNFLGTTDNQPLVFRTNNFEKVRLLANGNLGIGTTTPVAPLHVIGNFRASGKALIGPGTALNTPANYGEALIVDGATRLFSDLRVDGTDGVTLASSGAGIRFPDGSRQTTAFSNTTAGGDLIGVFPNPTIAASAVTNAKLASDAASLSKVSGGVMTSSGGYVGIGIATPVTPLHVSASNFILGFFENASTDSARLRLQNNNSIHAYDLMLTGNSSSFGGGKLLFYDGTSNAARITLDTSGNVGIGTTIPAYKLDVNGQVRASNVSVTSDARYKTNIATFPNALDTILDLRGVTFDWNRDLWQDKAFPTGRQVGFLAQEVESVLPELVTTDTNGYKAVAYQNIVPVLVEAMKQQQKQINALQADNAELKCQNTRIAELEAKLNALLSSRQGKSPR